MASTKDIISPSGDTESALRHLFSDSAIILALVTSIFYKCGLGSWIGNMDGCNAKLGLSDIPDTQSLIVKGSIHGLILMSVLSFTYRKLLKKVWFDEFLETFSVMNKIWPHTRFIPIVLIYMVSFFATYWIGYNIPITSRINQIVMAGESSTTYNG